MFGGVNLDQCVLHTLADANFLGYDTILVEDCAATTNPDFCREATLLNIRQIFGFTFRSGALMQSLADMMIAKSPAAELQAFRIAPGDSNYFACLFDPLADGVSFTLVVEIFEPGGRTPPNTHAIAEEVFSFWPAPAARSPGENPGDVGPGDALVLRPGTEHVVENTGPEALLPDDDGAERGFCGTDSRRHAGAADALRSRSHPRGAPLTRAGGAIRCLSGRDSRGARCSFVLSQPA